MNGTFGNSAAKDAGDWQNNSEMNPAANSSITNPTEGSSEEKEAAEGWRDDSMSSNKSGDPGRTPGKAEGVEDPEIGGNEDR